ncbi:hypothetical protein JCM18905_1990 [Vibrio sp. JCM 18905]|nr:hypothetical protein JCM18905_1990 [Vibrio sp. JCM 18905]
MEKMQWEKVLGDTVGQPVSFDEFSLTAVMFEEPKMIVNLELRVNELVIYALVGELIEERQIRGGFLKETVSGIQPMVQRSHCSMRSVFCSLCL